MTTSAQIAQWMKTTFKECPRLAIESPTNTKVISRLCFCACLVNAYFVQTGFCISRMGITRLMWRSHIFKVFPLRFTFPFIGSIGLIYTWHGVMCCGSKGNGDIQHTFVCFKHLTAKWLNCIFLTNGWWYRRKQKIINKLVSWYNNKKVL